jgi:membrane associated rhomboid family serine protease
MQPADDAPMDQQDWVEVARDADARRARHHMLVLQSVAIPCGSAQLDDGSQALLVRRHQARAALEQLERYDRENRAWPPREAPFQPIPAGGHSAILYGGLLALVHIVVIEDRHGVDWRALGRNASDLVTQGEWWRVATALTLHSDLAHLAGNIVFGAAFGLILSQGVGIGVAWLGILASGAVGNWFNVALRDEPHSSIGASTAVFGALGMQVAVEWARRGRTRSTGLRRWAPVVMGIGLLAWSGMGGITVETSAADRRAILDRVDVGAHLAGFFAGAALGLLAARFELGRRLSPRAQVALALLAPTILLLAWLRAAATLG